MSEATRRAWASKFVRNVLIWLLPAAVVWVILTRFYNPFLTKGAENLVRLSEGPAVTRLHVKDVHYFVITRTDQPASRGYLNSVRVTDTHFPLIMTFAFFMAVPGVPLRKRLENLGWATLISVFFHILSLFLWVKFIYATQMGEWSAANYGAFQQNFWGLSKHLADLPFKLALPILLWASFYFKQLLPRSAK